MSFEDFCSTPLWDYNLTWNTTTPDLTACFQDTVLVFFPFVIFILLAPFEVWSAYKSRRTRQKWCLLSVLKMVFNVLLLGLACLIAICKICIWHSRLMETSISTITAAIFEAVMFMLLLLFTIYVSSKGLTCSKVLSLFWLLQFISLLFRFYSYFLREHEVGGYALEYTAMTSLRIMFPMVFVQLILSCFNEPTSNRYQSFTDDTYEEEEDNCTVKKTPFFVFIFFAWMTRIILQGVKSKLTLQSLPPLCKSMTSAVVSKQFDRAFCRKGNSPQSECLSESLSTEVSYLEPSQKQRTPSLIALLLKTAWWPALISSLAELLYVIASLMPPFILKFMLSYIQSSEEHWHGYIYALSFYICLTFKSIMDNVCQYFSLVASINIKSALTNAVYKKIFRLSSEAKKDYMAGEIVNLMAVDTQEVFEFTYFFADFWSIPLRIGTSFYFLWSILGYSSLSTFGVMGVMTPLSFVIGKNADRLQTKLMEKKDDRMKEMSEILNGIKILKLYAWELPFMKRVLNIRDEELSALKDSSILEAFFAFLWITCPLTIALACFVTYSLSDASHVLDAETIFVAFAYVSLLRVPMGRLPDLVTRMIRAKVSLGRLKTFFSGDELDPFVVGKHPKQGDCITVDKATLSWTAQECEASLHDISLSVKKGSLVAIVGSTGSGKSSLFSAILGDMKKFSGSINVEGSVGYVAQQAWIQNATLQDNIIFTQLYKESRYLKVIDACALKPDLELLPGRDKAEIGEKGINLSGGQKQRVSLARAVYQDVDIYLLDDPLSAVDAHVASHIFNQVIGPSGFLRNKTRLLATHNIAFLSQVDLIIVVEKGTIKEQGTYSELMENKGHLFTFLQQHSNHNEEEKQEHEEKRTGVLNNEEKRTGVLNRQLSRLHSDVEGAWNNSDECRLIEDEGMEYGRISLKVYRDYFSQIGLPTTVVILAMFSMSGISEIGSGLWLSYGNPSVSNSSIQFFLGVYGGFIGVNAMSNMVSYAVLFFGSVLAAAKIHNNLLTAVMKSPLSFFDTTPMGRILNRFSKDVESMDTEVPWGLGNWLNMMVFFPLLVAVIGSSSPYIIAVILPVAIVYICILRVYVKTTNQFRRLESVSKSPVFTNFSETLLGVSSIRAFGVQQYFVNRCNKRMDDNMKCYFLSESSQRWLDSSLSIISGFIILAVTLTAVIGRGSVEAGLLGLVLNYCFDLSDGLSWMVKLTANIENRVVSLERISEYSHLPPEADWEKQESKPELTWPEKGSVVFDKFSITYREGLDPVLKDINLKIEPSSKVGVVGRTGAGKSSLILSLFRIMEPLTGKIEIDGIDISCLGLHDLRSKLTVIPQDPVLFAGSLRSNLDPWEQCTDDNIWESLERAHLKEFVSGLSSGLSHFVTEGGDNLSAGQRQLLCLARALLRHTKILILDEATASVDLDTDQLIQATIREAFSTCTIITIAHRLHTVMDYDRIIVLSEGRVVEDGSPDTLKRDPTSHFYSMAKDAGLV